MAEGDATFEKGTHFRDRADLVDALKRWFEQTDEDTIGDLSYGRAPWLNFDSPAGLADLNADTRRTAIERMLAHARRAPDAPWEVIENNRGKVNKIVFDTNDTHEGWYAYLREPLAAPTTSKGTPLSQHAYIVQFPHPGGEHRPKTDVMPWNTEAHKRKFMTTAATYVDESGSSKRGPVVFWGEFEGHSRVVSRWPAGDPLPQMLHEPYLDTPPNGVVRQNTDPWVFGDRFHYSNCKQVTNHGRTVTAMQRLTEGSLILFGSSVDGHFVLDTALVIARKNGSYSPRNYDHLDVDDAFRIATLESLEPAADPSVEIPLTLFDGATPDDSVNGMFSFVPALPRDGEPPRFARPHIELPEINPKSKQSTRGSTKPRSLEEVRNAWEAVKQQVLDQDLVLATRLELPRRETK
ncbi:MAG: hypothetical protein M3456_14000 [Actinomycetota bacterium]|nr:hypothetical protein [Actinomycetota bacterium]